MPLLRLFIFPIALLICVFADAQEKRNDVWDSALDRYEKICDECIELKARIAAGGKVTREEASGVIAELSELRLQLNGENGQMSPQQHERFKWIQECFEKGKKVSECLKFEEGTSAPTDTDAGKTYDTEQGWGSDGPDRLPPASSADDVVQDGGEKGKRNNVKIVLLAGFNPYTIGGLVMEMPGRFGGYVKVLSSLRSYKYSYSCKSDGTAVFPDGSEGIFLADPGSVTHHRHFSATAGFAYAPKTFVDVRIGIGYGLDRYFWTDTDGRSVLVGDKSNEGVAFDIGADFNWRRLTVGAGVETISFHTVTPYLGIGVNF